MEDKAMHRKRFFDDVVFDPKGDLEAYASGFAVKNLKG